MTTAFPYCDGLLHAEDVSLAHIAQAVGTPFYLYSTAAMAESYTALAQALGDLDATICYALKANGNLAVVRSFAEMGAGADVVSEGELRRALEAGIPPQRIVFAGVGKTEAEMIAGLDAGILQFNVESRPELERLDQVARDRGTQAAVALRVNPNVDALTHAKISTGKAENKFGIDFDQARTIVANAEAWPGIRIEGLAVHIGSQLTDLAPYDTAFGRVAELYRELKAAGLPLKRLDLGGGLGIAYGTELPPSLDTYAALARRHTADLDASLIFEPGRLLIGNAGLLVTKVIFVKEGASRRFVVVDAAMNDLIRPTLYDAWHAILPVKEPADTAESWRVDVVGPICESSDTFAQERALPPVDPGDLLAICSTGAYGAVMTSSYNMRLPTPEVLVRGQDYAVVRPRMDYATLLAQDRLPQWFEDTTKAASRGAA